MMTLVEQIQHQVRATPSRAAISTSGRQLSYAALDELVNGLCEKMRTAGAVPGSCVVVSLESGVDSVAALLATWRMGATYVPLDPSLQLDKWRGVLRTARPSVVIMQEQPAELLDDVGVVAIQGGSRPASTRVAEPRRHGDAAVLLRIDGELVGLSHEILRRRVGGLRERLEVTADDLFLHGAAVGSDRALVEVLTPLAAGAGLVLASRGQASADDGFAHAWGEQGATLAYLSPSEFVEAMSRLPAARKPRLRALVIAGEVLSSDLALRLGTMTTAALYGTYVPRPLMRETTWHDLRADLGHTPVLGDPLDNDIFLLDRDRQPVPIGVIGDIWLGADGLVGAAEVAHLVADETIPGEACRIVRTRDQGRWRDDGRIQLVDCADRFLWWRGQQIDLAAVESTLLESPLLESCAVRHRRAADGTLRLVAYVVARSSIAAGEIADRVRPLLEEGTRPSDFVPIGSLPLTPTGAIDEDALARIPVLDPLLVAQWEAELKARGTPAVVMVTSSPVPGRTWSREDLFSWPSAERAGAAGPASPPTARSTASNDPGGPAYVRGQPLIRTGQEPRTLAAALERTALRHPDRGILHIGRDGAETYLRYPELLNRAGCVAGGLRAHGLGPGQPLVLHLGSELEHLVAFWGAILAGLLPVTVVPPPSYKERNGVLGKLFGTLTLLGRAAVLTRQDLVAEVEQAASLYSRSVPWLLPVEALEASACISSRHEGGEDDVALLQLSSGSTGAAKIVQLTYRNLVHHLLAARQKTGGGSEDSILNWLPRDHVVPLVTLHLRGVYFGSPQVELAADRVIADPLDLLDSIDRHRITFSFMPNFGFKMVAARLSAEPDRRWDLSHVRCWLNGGEQVTSQVMNSFLGGLRSSGLRPSALVPGYGMAELSTAVTYENGFDASASLLQCVVAEDGSVRSNAPEGTASSAFVSVGGVAPEVEIRIADASGEVVRQSKIGRIQIRGAVVTPGYYENPEADRETRLSDGWFDSGDLGFLKDGKLYVTGRLKEMIVVRGANFFCHEIEGVVGQLPFVEPGLVAACAAHDPEAGSDSAVVFFVPQTSGEGSTQDFVRRIREHLAAQLGLSPLAIIPLSAEEFPRTTAGKVQRGELQAAFKAGRFSTRQAPGNAHQASPPGTPDWFFRVVWRPHRGEQVGEQRQPSVVRRIGNGPLSAAFARICPEHDGPSASAFGRSTVVVVFLDEPDPLPGESIGRTPLEALLAEVRALNAIPGSERPARMVFALRMQSTTEWAALSGLLATVQHELEGTICKLVRVEGRDVGVDAENVRRELLADCKEPDVMFSGALRQVPRLAQVDMRAERATRPPVKRAGRYLIAGGLGGLGTELAARLLREHQAQILILGRTSLDGSDGRAREKARRLASLRSVSESVRYAVADLTDANAVQAAVQAFEEESGGPLDGVFNLAGSFRERELHLEEPADVHAILNAAERTAHTLESLAQTRPAMDIVYFSSVYAMFGAFRMGAYGAEHRLRMAVADRQRKQGLRVWCIGWSQWDGVGMTEAFTMRETAESRGYTAVGVREGLDSLEAVLARPPSSWLIGLDAQKANVARWCEGPVQNRQRLIALVKGEGADRTARAVTLHDAFSTPLGAEEISVPELPGPIGERQELVRDLLAGVQGRGDAFVGPRDEAERRLAAVWTKLLRVPRVGIKDSFFSLGGHSLLGVQLMAIIRQEFGRDVPLGTLFEHPTLEQLAKVLGGPDIMWSPLVSLGGSGTGDPVYCVHPGGGTVFCYRALAAELGVHRRVFALQARGLAEGQVPHEQIEDMAAEYVDALPPAQTSSRYALAGWSLGGLIAFEMARQIERAGGIAPKVIMIDPVPPMHDSRYADMDDADVLVATARDLGGQLDADALRALDEEGQQALFLAAVRRVQDLPQDVGTADVARFLPYVRATGRSVAAYRPGRYGGPVAIFRSADGPAPGMEPWLGWRPFLGRSASIRTVPGSHASLIQPPHAHALARRMHDFIQGNFPAAELEFAGLHVEERS